jgi:hypothetical protein
VQVTPLQGGVHVQHPPSLLGWTIDAARLSAFSALADVDSQLQMEREFSFHLQLADVAPRLQMEMEEMCESGELHPFTLQ